MTDPALSTLAIAIIAFLVGLVISNLYSRIVATDKDEAMEEASQLIADLLADNERLEAKLDELRRRLDALGKIDWGKVGD